MTRKELAAIDRILARGGVVSDAQASDLVAEVRRLTSEVEKLKESDTRAWTRGFFSALAYHCDGTDLEEGIESTGLLTAADAIAAGAEEQDVSRQTVVSAFAHIARTKS